ncbi:MAG: hypothetical protein ACI8T1_003266 [Verrucomicrobiales bacterium]
MPKSVLLAVSCRNQRICYVRRSDFGKQTEVPAGILAGQGTSSRSRALYRFDIASVIPADAVITSAQLQVSVVRTPSAAASSTFAIHRVLKRTLPR